MERHPIMDKTLPAILDELREAIDRVNQAVIDAEGHAGAARASALEAQDAIAAALSPLKDELGRVKADARKAIELGQIAADNNAANAKAIELNSTAIKNLADGIDRVSAEVRELGVAVVNGLKRYGEFVVANVSFLHMEK